MDEQRQVAVQGDGTILLGVDGATRRTGWGIIEATVRRGRPLYRFIACGVISAPASRPLPARLAIIARGLVEVIEKYQPEEAAVELAFLSESLIKKNPRTAIALGEARGAILLTLAQHGVVKTFDYAPRDVKAVASGKGSASKSEVAEWVKRSLEDGRRIQSGTFDETDALAIALTHAIRRKEKALLGAQIASRKVFGRRRTGVRSATLPKRLQGRVRA